eukprot:3142550-Amphidinium_carterae.1
MNFTTSWMCEVEGTFAIINDRVRGGTIFLYRAAKTGRLVWTQDQRHHLQRVDAISSRGGYTLQSLARLQW